MDFIMEDNPWEESPSEVLPKDINTEIDYQTEYKRLSQRDVLVDDCIRCACDIFLAEKERAELLGDDKATEVFNFALETMRNVHLLKYNDLKNIYENVKD